MESWYERFCRAYAGCFGFFQVVYMWALAGAYKHGAISIAYPLLRTLPVLLIAIMTALLAWIQVISAAPLVSKPPEYSPQKTSVGVR